MRELYARVDKTCHSLHGESQQMQCTMCQIVRAEEASSDVRVAKKQHLMYLEKNPRKEHIAKELEGLSETEPQQQISTTAALQE